MNISVIIPAYKAQRHIEKCLDSIVAQTYFKNNDYEIILGIDGCEETLKKVKNIRYKYPRLRVLWCKENKGCYVMTNTLIQQVKYDYIQKFDADDWMKKDMVKKVAGYMNRFDIAMCLCERHDGKQTIRTGQSINSILIKKEVYDKLGGYCPWICAADGEFMDRAIRSFKVAKVKEPLFYYYKHSTSLTGKMGKKSSKRKAYHDIKKQMNKDKVVYVKPITNKFEEL